MHLYNFDTHNHKAGPIKNGQYYVKERGIIMIPEVPVGRSFQRADGTLILIKNVDFETDVYTIHILKDGKTEAMATHAKNLIKKLTTEKWVLNPTQPSPVGRA